jgi:hypothetical protein
VLSYVLVGQQRKRGGFARPVAGRTVGEHKWSDIFAEGDRSS